METLWLPFLFPFMQTAFLVAALVAVPTALLSCFLVLKGWSLMGDAVSHAVLPGIVLAYMIGLPLAIGAFVAGLGCAVCTGYVSDTSRVKVDTVLGVVFSGMFALGLVLIARVPSELHLEQILFGDMLGVLPYDLWFAAAIAFVVSLALLVFWRDLMLYIFDVAQARVVGLPTTLIYYGFLTLLSLAVVGALKAVGIILTIALLIAPGAIALLMTRRFGAMLICATLVSVISALTGVYASFFIGSSPASTIVVVQMIIFCMAFVVDVRRLKRASADC